MYVSCPNMRMTSNAHVLVFVAATCCAVACEPDQPLAAGDASPVTSAAGTHDGGTDATLVSTPPAAPSAAGDGASSAPSTESDAMSPAQPAGDAGDTTAQTIPARDASVSAVVLDDRQTLVPDATWACGMPDGIPGPLTGPLAFDIDFEIAQERDVGTTPFGRRRQLDIRAGTVTGGKLAGRVLAGGLEYELTLDNGVAEIEQIHVLQLGDELVFMRNCGVSPAAGVPARIVLAFEAANDGAYAFLNTGRFVATRVYDPRMGLVQLEVHELMTTADATNAVRVVKPAGRPSQSWTCKPSARTQGAEVYQATVEVSPEWWTVGDSKYGLRNIIPILGGSMSGKIKGRVLAGGADYQIIVGNFELDARYALQTDDGELILVRNCGQLGALVPTFETRSDGPYAWLNQGAFLSADPLPSLDLSQIYLTIYEAR